MNPRVIVIDGKTYNSVEEMPPDIRQKYERALGSLKDINGDHMLDAYETANILEDRNKDGMPDVFENLASVNTVASSLKIVIDGKEYNRIEDLPSDARARYEAAMGRMDANRDGIPDFVEGMFTSMSQTATVPSNEGITTPRRAAPPVSPSAPTATPDTSNGLMLALAGLFIFLLCIAGAGALWYFFLR